jgi:hypothetical protein
MKRNSLEVKLLILIFALTAFSICLFQTSRSTANSSPGDNSRAVSSRQDKGTMVARLKYEPAVHGFGFKNYGRDHDNENDLNPGNLVALFGAENVCQSGTSASDCVLTEPAEEWLEQCVKLLEGGHCEGLAVTSLRFWEGLPFAGKASPADFQSGAEKVFDLEHTNLISNYVAHYHVMQKLSEISDFRAETWKKKPSEILRMLIDSMKDNSTDHYVMSIGMREDGRYTRGHAITPYGVEDMGDGEYHILVYDSNYKGESKYVELNAKEETWRYHTASDPTKTANDYVGDATTQTLGLKSQKARELDVYGCPFCSDSSERALLHHASAKKTKKDQVSFVLTGEGETLVTDPNGKRIGYDFAKNRLINEIPEADIVPIEGGMGKNIPPQYRLPHMSSTKPYTITVGGKSIDKEVDADLDMEGAGFIVGFADILIDPGETLSMTISPNGRELSFTASADGETPSVFITIETGKKNPSYEFEIGGIKLAAGKTVTMKLDLEKQKLFFKDNDPDRDPYDVFVTRTNPDGTEDYYENDDLDLAKKSDNYEMDFSKWDGKGDMCFEEDDENNGFEDEECTKEPNEKKKPAKPGAAVNYFDRRQPIAMLLRY